MFERFDERAYGCPLSAGMGFKKTCRQMRDKMKCPKFWELPAEKNGIDDGTIGACRDWWEQFTTRQMITGIKGLQSAVETRGDANETQQARAAQALERIANVGPIVLEPQRLLLNEELK